MTSSPATDESSVRPASDTSKVRHCLRCNDSFSSEWAGERICSRCKKSSTWRNGDPYRPVPNSDQR